MHVEDLGNASLFALKTGTRRQNSPKYASGEPLTFLNVGTEGYYNQRSCRENIINFEL